MLKKSFIVLAILIALPGIVWFGQGIGVIHGSFMTGEVRWAVIGAIMIMVAAALFWFSRGR